MIHGLSRQRPIDGVIGVRLWEHVSGAGSQRWAGVVKNDGAGAERGAGVIERERSDERTKLAAQISLQGDMLLKLRNMLYKLYFTPCQK